MNYNRVYLSCLSFRLRSVLAMISGLLVGLPFLFPNLFILSWFGFVPLLFALHKTNIIKAYVLGLLCGLSASVCAVYWIEEFIFHLKGYEKFTRILLSIAFWLYSAHIIAAVTIVFNLMRKVKKVSDFLAFPVIVCIVFSVFPLLFSIQLGASQSHFLVALQAIDLTGVYGLDFIIALTNVIIYKICLRTQEKGIVICATMMVTFWLGYGMFSLSKYQTLERQWTTQKIGIVQPNEAPSINVPPPAINYSHAFSPKLTLTQSLAHEDVVAVIWPESRFQGYFRDHHVKTAFQYYIKDFDTHLIFQDIEKSRLDGVFKKYNSSVFINNDGVEQGHYRKRKLVPIGESLPLFSENKAVRKVVKKYFGDFFSDYSEGVESVNYRINDTLFFPFVCYEIMFPRLVAKTLSEGSSEAKILVTQSNNTWFGDSHQPYQHLYASVLRSVENRTPMVHALNNGPSAVVMPSGEIIFQSTYNQAAAYIVDVPIGKTTLSFFSSYPNLFMNAIYILFSCLVLYSVFVTRRLGFNRS